MLIEQALLHALAVDVHRAASRRSRTPRGHKTSTLQGLEASRTLEPAAIVDAVVELADLTDVAAPTLRAVAAAIALLAGTLGSAEPSQ